jgi:hypothetical protein
MSINELINENEFTNLLYKLKGYRDDYETNIPKKHQEELLEVKTKLIETIEKIKSCGCYNTIPSDSDKADIETLYNELTQ